MLQGTTMEGSGNKASSRGWGRIGLDTRQGNGLGGGARNFLEMTNHGL